nr:lipopolysaccharide assembly protein LapA domain-containing protein [Listeria weihenstephanensis]
MFRMKVQWQVIVGIVLAIVIAIFAIINVDSVEVNFLFAKASWPLILIILGSVLIGCLIFFCLNIVRVNSMKKQIKTLEAAKKDLERNLAAEKSRKVKVSEVEVADEAPKPTV